MICERPSDYYTTSYSKINIQPFRLNPLCMTRLIISCILECVNGTLTDIPLGPELSWCQSFFYVLKANFIVIVVKCVTIIDEYHVLCCD